MFSASIRALGAAAVLAIALTTAAHAQDKMASPAPKMATPAPKMSSSKPTNKMTGPVYVCKICKVYMSPTDAKKMGYKDAMGHKMVIMDKMPTGYMDASKMSGKMDKMATPAPSKMAPM